MDPAHALLIIEAVRSLLDRPGHVTRAELAKALATPPPSQGSLDVSVYDLANYG